MSCQALKTNGIRCSVLGRNGAQFCGTHINAREHQGPNKWVLKQLKISQKLARDRVAVRNTAILNETEDANERVRREAELRTDYLELYNRQRLEYRNLVLAQQEEVERTGIDPDAAVNERIRLNTIRNEQIRQQRRLQIEEERRADHLRALQVHIDHENIRNNAQILENIRNNVQILQNNAWNYVIPPLEAVAPQQRELRDFARDPQNVHTRESVEATKKIVARVRQIPVPDEYAWNPNNASLTPFEIGLSCRLSQKAAWQMMGQYAQDTAIYEIEAGIYGKVLDSVWQFVKNSPDKESLCSILRRELEDNIGMCAQGNLSRVCNVLAGYVDGIGSVESLSEKLGRLFPPLLNVEDMFDRLSQGIDILGSNSVPRDQWNFWLESLATNEEETRMYELMIEV